MKNVYGDVLKPTTCGYGVDIASQRADDLDRKALDYIAACQAPTRALDLACGLGGQALRMAEAGAHVIAVDIVNYGHAIQKSADQANASVTFLQEDMRCLPGKLAEHQPFDLALSQRAIHYLPYGSARLMIGAVRLLIAQEGRLYLSASGIHSELGHGYTPGPSSDIETRYAELSQDMATKHGIHGPVCLYSVDELAYLVERAGFTVMEAFASPFGNVKLVAQKSP